jgi:hypothetical protein
MQICKLLRRLYAYALGEDVVSNTLQSKDADVKLCMSGGLAGRDN